MDSFIERLRDNKYFTYLAVIFFAFLTALIFAILALQSPTSDEIRTSVTGSANPGTTQTGTVDNYGSGSSSQGGDGAQGQQSPLDKIISVLTGKSSTTGSSTSQTPSGSGGAQAPDMVTQESQQADVIEKTLRTSTSLPDIRIDKYILVTEIPSKPTSLVAHKVKTTYTDLDVADLATKLGFTSIDAVEKLGTVSQLYDLGNGHYLGFNRENGNFNYQSAKGFKPLTTGSNPQQTAKNLLSQIGIDEAGIKAYATYKRTDTPGSIFVELHRDWTSTGAPILSPVGMLNLSPQDRLDSLSFTSQPDNTHPDNNIFAATDNLNGFSRPDSFNTITVELSVADNQVKAISSNIPRIIETQVLDQASIMSPIDAFNRYKEGQTSFGLAGPAGVGTVSLADVFSNGIAASSSVDVTDFELVYAAPVGNTLSEWWCPTYAFKSFGKVQTGFEAQFAHTVPASTDPRCQTAVLGTNSGELLAQNTGTLPTPDTSKVLPTTIVGGPNKNASSLQYGTLGFKVNVVIDTPVDECPTNFNHSYVIKETSTYTDYIAWIDDSRRATGRRAIDRVVSFVPRKWYFVRKKKAGVEASLESLNPSFSQAQLFAFRREAMSHSRIGDTSLSPLDPKFGGLQTVSCQHIVTASPWIHVYSAEKTDFNVHPDAIGGVSYVQPAFTSLDTQSWDVTTSSNQPAELFWEYNRFNVLRAYDAYVAQHPAPHEGFVVATSQLKSFIGGLSQKIGLNSAETAHVLSELNRSSMQFDTPFVQVRFAPQGFVDSALPLTVNPKPAALNRIYFQLTPRTSFVHLSTPELPTVVREASSTVVETGFLVTQ